MRKKKEEKKKEKKKPNSQNKTTTTKKRKPLYIHSTILPSVYMIVRQFHYTIL